MILENGSYIVEIIAAKYYYYYYYYICCLILIACKERENKCNFFLNFGIKRDNMPFENEYCDSEISINTARTYD